MSNKDDMVTEWAVQYRSYIGGKFDRTVPINSRSGFPHSEESAKEQVQRFNKGKESMTPSRVVTREATPWRVP